MGRSGGQTWPRRNQRQEHPTPGIVRQSETRPSQHLHRNQGWPRGIHQTDWSTIKPTISCCPTRFKASINKVKTRTYPGTGTGSDHDLVQTNLKLKARRLICDVEKPQDPNVPLAADSKEVQQLMSTAREVLGRQRTKKAVGHK
ncbi:hypothetical protein C0Q70_15903 [Pomacea canaliculata]|uniref:Uncharacterized protein n=1 Tax=Pomacea canaliculata TaxID=400727 RepID=A0A2T7NNA1_POMCA|nr:hypothetical protein C0Q70_15903 [Pomacea canaliculata]